MSARHPNELLKFPSGISVRQLKADATKRVKEDGIPRHEALDALARENGIDLPWGEALSQLKLEQELLPELTITYKGTDDYNHRWFRCIPFVTELLDEVSKPQLADTIRYHVREEDADRRSIHVSVAYHPANQPKIAYLDQAIASMAKFANLETAVKLEITTRCKGKPEQVHIDSELTYLYGATMTRGIFVQYYGKEPLHTIPIHLNTDVEMFDSPEWLYSGMHRIDTGYEVTFIEKKERDVYHRFTSEQMQALIDLSMHLDSTFSQLFIRHQDELQKLIELDLLRKDERGELVTPYQLTFYGYTLLRGAGRARTHLLQSTPL